MKVKVFEGDYQVLQQEIEAFVGDVLTIEHISQSSTLGERSLGGKNSEDKIKCNITTIVIFYD